jgi:hypothetical protein
MSDTLFVWIILILIIRYYFEFRDSCFAFKFYKAEPLNSDLTLRTWFSLQE